MFDLKYAATLKTGLWVRQCHWKCHHSIEHITSYWCSLATMVLSRVVSETFNVEKYRNLEIPVKGQSRSLKAIDRLCTVSY